MEARWRRWVGGRGGGGGVNAVNAGLKICVVLVANIVFVMGWCLTTGQIHKIINEEAFCCCFVFVFKSQGKVAFLVSKNCTEDRGK